LNARQYNDLVYAHSDGLYRFALRLCRDDDQAKDLVQISFEKVWLKCEDIPADKGKSYLFRTLYNSFVDTTRKMKPDRIGEHCNAVSELVPHHDLKEILHDALNQLPEAQKSAVLLRDYEGYNYQEIGEILNLSESQVKVYIFRARKALQQIIGKIEAVL
jgi:RNA polymerase sigma factor (sigma-70 family)